MSVYRTRGILRVECQGDGPFLPGNSFSPLTLVVTQLHVGMAREMISRRLLISVQTNRQVTGALSSISVPISCIFLQIAVTVPTVSSIEDSTANLFVLVKKRGCPVHGVLRAPLLRQGMQLLLFGLKASSFHQEITSNHCRRPLCGQ